jgi:hypothetical protein
VSPLTDAEIREDGERRHFYTRLARRGLLLESDWTRAEVAAYVVHGVAPERETQAGEAQWKQAANETFTAWERRRERAWFEERMTGRVRPSHEKARDD